MSPTLLLVDGTALFVRSHRAGQQTRMNADGVPTGTLTLFTHSLARLLRAHQPSHVLVALDGPDARQWRRKLFPGYKADRADPPLYESREMRLLLDFCYAAGVHVITEAGFEADDVIAWAWRRARTEQMTARIVIAADDADLHQLLWPQGLVTQVTLGVTDRVMDYDAVISRYGCEPDQLPYLRALAGDPSDGIPGLPGVGPVKALAMLRSAGWSLSAATETMDPEQVRLIHMYEDILDLIRPVQAIDYQRGMERYPVMEITEWSSGKATGAAEFFGRMKMIKTLAKLEAGSLW